MHAPYITLLYYYLMFLFILDQSMYTLIEINYITWFSSSLFLSPSHSHSLYLFLSLSLPTHHTRSCSALSLTAAQRTKISRQISPPCHVTVVVMRHQQPQQNKAKTTAAVTAECDCPLLFSSIYQHYKSTQRQNNNVL